MGITRVIVKPGDTLSEEGKKRIEEAAKRPIVYDEDSPYFTYEELVEMVEKTKERKRQEKKEVVALRVRPATLERAKSVGKGYTGFMSRLLDLAIMDPEMVQKALDSM